MIALTATADNATRKDIFDRLGLSDAKMFVSGFDRPNINYKIIDKNSPKNQLLAFIKGEYSNDSGIVYCQSRNKVEEIAAWLSSEGITAVPYHAGLDQRIREKHHTRFIQEENVVVVATIAFGMGINKPNVRFVAHLDLPRTLEAYYQETGRAGRDGLPATAWMTYGLSDVVETKYRILTSELDERQKRIEFQNSKHYSDIARATNADEVFCSATSANRKMGLAATVIYAQLQLRPGMEQRLRKKHCLPCIAQDNNSESVI